MLIQCPPSVRGQQSKKPGCSRWAGPGLKSAGARMAGDSDSEDKHKEDEHKHGEDGHKHGHHHHHHAPVQTHKHHHAPTTNLDDPYRTRTHAAAQDEDSASSVVMCSGCAPARCRRCAHAAAPEAACGRHLTRNEPPAPADFGRELLVRRRGQPADDPSGEVGAGRRNGCATVPQECRASCAGRRCKRVTDSVPSCRASVTGGRLSIVAGTWRQSVFTMKTRR